MAYTSHFSLCIWLQDHILDLWLECLHFWTLQSLYPWSSLTTIVHHPSLFYSNSPSCYWLGSTSQKLIHWSSLNLPVPAPPASTNFHYSDIQPWSWADTHSNSCPDFQLSPFRVPVLLFLSSSKGVSWPHPPFICIALWAPGINQHFQLSGQSSCVAFGSVLIFCRGWGQFSQLLTIFPNSDSTSFASPLWKDHPGLNWEAPQEPQNSLNLFLFPQLTSASAHTLTSLLLSPYPWKMSCLLKELPLTWFYISFLSSP